MIQNAPQINTNDDKVGVLAWHVKDGDQVKKNMPIVDLETSKAAVTVNAEFEGFIKILVKNKDVISVGKPICEIFLTKKEYEVAKSSQSKVNQNDQHHLNDLPFEIQSMSHITFDSHRVKTRYFGNFSTTRFSKAALENLTKLNVPVANFAKAGLITFRSLQSEKENSNRQDDLNLLSNTSELNNNLESYPSNLPSSSREEAISLSKDAEIKTLGIGEVGNINSTLSIHFDSEKIIENLTKNKASSFFSKDLQSLIMYEISRVLVDWPQFTAFFSNNKIYYYDRVDLGIAIDLGKGLKVVTLKEANKLMPAEIQEKITQYSLDYVRNQIKPEDLVGSTITITDLSSHDILHFKPLINGNQSAIIGIGGDKEAIGKPLSINLTFDHRVSNGREAALFLKELKSRILAYGEPKK